MKGIHFVTNERSERIAVQIDLELLQKDQEAVEDLLDALVAEMRKDEEKIPFEQVLQNLRNAGKIK